MEPSNTGSFAAATGGMSPELQAAITKRAGGNPSGPMAQTTASAPTNNPQVPPSSPSLNPIIPAETPQTAVGSSAGLPGGNTESKIIIQALKGRLEALSKGGVLQ